MRGVSRGTRGSCRLEGKIRRVCDDGRVNVVTVENGEGSLMGMGLWAIEL